MTTDPEGPLRTDRVDQLVERMAMPVLDLLSRIDAEAFSTVQFIDFMQTLPETKAAYDDAIRWWGENETGSKMVIHGQVIPAILRRSGQVEWAGYAHDEVDPYAVPAWWRMLPDSAE